ncbi:hypothetical protein [Klebsiella pneumoniae]|uniref:hypothetical protein n=2 Tax=Klebsiella pneumoniae TaxID=573 RepID=UPI00155D8A9F|nr:hypothetical protein [Klebsiella pneumoniae]
MSRDENIQAVFDLKAGYTLGLADIEILKRVARMALAAMDGEPVVFTDERNLHHIAMGRETSLIWGKQNHEAGDIPLFRHAKPAPVVPVVPDALIKAVDFYEQVKRENPSVETGAWKDAVEWVLKEACLALRDPLIISPKRNHV